MVEWFEKYRQGMGKNHVPAAADFRAACPRRSHGEWQPGPDRADPLSILADEERGRIAELLPLRHERMAGSAFAFFRGAAAIMAADLATTPTTGILVQACGDAHLANFGAYAAPDRRLVFDINDFDETLPAPWEWDVKRLAASIVIVSRESGLGEGTRRRFVKRAIAAYRDAMNNLADMSNLDVWYARVEVKRRLKRLARERPDVHLRPKRVVGKAQKMDDLRALAKLTDQSEGVLRFRDDPPLLVPARTLPPPEDGRTIPDMVQEVFSAYRSSLEPHLRALMSRFRTVDVARKVVGVGSVGTEAWVAMLDGDDGAAPLFLQIKEATPSVLEPFAGRSTVDHAGQRVVCGQRYMQTASDPFLGWASLTREGKTVQYYVRQLWDWKWSAPINAMSADQFGMYAVLCARTLARAHARSGDRWAIAAYLGMGDGFTKALTQFAETYADVNANDRAALVAAIRSGRISSLQ